MKPFALTVDGKAATIEIDGQTYRARVKSQGWWTEDGRRDIEIDLTLIVKDGPVRAFEATFGQPK